MKTEPSTSSVQTLTAILQNRCTTKAMADTPWPCPTQDPQQLAQILSAAGEAPFHKPAPKDSRQHDLDGIQPWRCYHLDANQCRKLRQRLLETGDTTKIPQMLAVADYLIQVTWLPEPKPQDTDSLFEPSLQNMEHIAATSAAIQNMLLAATSRNIPNYWSSGGALRSPEIFAQLGIPHTEILLGSLFLFPSDLPGAETAPGSLRSSRSPLTSWSRQTSL